MQNVKKKLFAITCLSRRATKSKRNCMHEIYGWFLPGMLSNIQIGFNGFLPWGIYYPRKKSSRSSRAPHVRMYGKGKVPPGCLLAEPVTYRWPDFPFPLEPGFGIMPLSSALSKLHMLCAAWLLPRMISIWDVPTRHLQTFACFCTNNHTQPCKVRLFPQWLSQVIMTGAYIGYPEMGEPAL